jgi:hypothetical protein
MTPPPRFIARLSAERLPPPRLAPVPGAVMNVDWSSLPDNSVGNFVGNVHFAYRENYLSNQSLRWMIVVAAYGTILYRFAGAIKNDRLPSTMAAWERRLPFIPAKLLRPRERQIVPCRLHAK